MLSTKSGLPAKVSSPYIDRFVPRETLFGVMDKASLRPGVTWVAAPGGAGKTLLTKSFLDIFDITTFWYQVDIRDRDPATLFHYLSLAVSKHVPEALPNLAPEYLSNLHAFSANYFESLFTQLDDRFILVFDNCQDVPAESPFFDLLKWALEQLPIGGHIVCLSRENPPPTYAALRTKQQLTLIDEQMLRFSAEEIQGLAELNQNEISAEDAQRLQKKTLGWAAGLVLLIDDPELMELDDSHFLTSSSNLLFDYFSSEFFSQWPEEQRDFLIKTAILPRVSVSAAESLTGNENAGTLLTGLEKKNFFTMLYSARPRVYQYHPMFREFLQIKAKEQLSANDLKELRDKAAQILLQDHDLEDAVNIFISNRDWPSLAKAIVTNAKQLISKGRFQTLSAWITSIPAEERVKSPWLVYWHGVSVQPFAPRQSYQLYEQAFELFSQTEDKIGLVLSWVALPDAVTFSLGNYHIFDDWLEKFEAHIGTDFTIANDDIDARLSKSMLNIFSFRSVERSTLNYWVERGEALLNTNIDINLKVQLGCRLFHTYFNTGLLLEEKRIYEKIDPIATGDYGVLPMYRILWCVYKALYGWNSNQIDITKQAVGLGINQAKDSGIHALDSVIRCIAALHFIAIGDIKNSRDLLSEVSPTLSQSSPLHLTMFYLATGSQALEEGNLHDAVDALKISVDTMREDGGLFPQIHCQLVLAHALLELNEHGTSEKLINELEKLNEKHQSEITQFNILIYKSSLAYKTQDHASLMPLLTQAFDLLTNHSLTITHLGYRRQLFAELCATALDNKIHIKMVSEIIQAQNLPAPRNAGAQWPWYCRIQTLGDFSLTIAGEEFDMSKLKAKPRAILLSLLANGCTNVPEEKITEIVWPDADGDAAHSAFSTTIHRLRKTLGNDEFIQVKNRLVSLNKHLVWVDVHACQTINSKVSDQTPDDEYQQLCAPIFDMYKGDFLPHIDEVWVQTPRDKMRRCFLKHLQKVAEQHLLSGDLEKAIDMYNRGLEIDPVAEIFYQGLMRAYASQGAKPKLVDTYMRCNATLLEELSVQPSDKTESLFKSLSGH